MKYEEMILELNNYDNGLVNLKSDYVSVLRDYIKSTEEIKSKTELMKDAVRLRKKYSKDSSVKTVKVNVKKRKTKTILEDNKEEFEILIKEKNQLVKEQRKLYGLLLKMQSNKYNLDEESSKTNNSPHSGATKQDIFLETAKKVFDVPIFQKPEISKKSENKNLAIIENNVTNTDKKEIDINSDIYKKLSNEEKIKIVRQKLNTIFEEGIKEKHAGQIKYNGEVKYVASNKLGIYKDLIEREKKLERLLEENNNIKNDATKKVTVNNSTIDIQPDLITKKNINDINYNSNIKYNSKLLNVSLGSEYFKNLSLEEKINVYNEKIKFFSELDDEYFKEISKNDFINSLKQKLVKLENEKNDIVKNNENDITDNNSKSIVVNPDLVKNTNIEELEVIRKEINELLEQGYYILNTYNNIPYRLVIYNKRLYYIPKYRYIDYVELRQKEKAILKEISKEKNKIKKKNIINKLKVITGISLVSTIIKKIKNKNKVKKEKRTLREKIKNTSLFNWFNKIKESKKDKIKEKNNNSILNSSSKKKKNRIITSICAGALIIATMFSCFGSKKSKKAIINNNNKIDSSFVNNDSNSNINKDDDIIIDNKDNFIEDVKKEDTENDKDIQNNTSNDLIEDNEHDNVLPNDDTNNDLIIENENNEENKEHLEENDISIGDTIQINDGAKIYTNSYDATYGTNSYNAYFDNSSDRIVEAVVYELNGYVYTIYNYDMNANAKIRELENNGATLTAVLVNRSNSTDSNNYEGYYSFESVKTLSKTR